MFDEARHVCLRKIRYRSRHRAATAARHAQHAMGRMSVYRCPFSEGAPHWHIGHRRERESRDASLSRSP